MVLCFEGRMGCEGVRVFDYTARHVEIFVDILQSTGVCRLGSYGCSSNVRTNLFIRYRVVQGFGGGGPCFEL